HRGDAIRGVARSRGRAVTRLEAAEEVEVGEVLRPRGRRFVSHQLSLADEECALVPERALHATVPRFFEADTTDVRDDVDSVGWEAELDDLTRRREIFFEDVERTESKFIQSSNDTPRVFRR